MLVFVCGGIVQGKQRVEVFQRILRCGSAHLLRFVEDQNGPVGSDDIYRLSAAEVVQFFTDSAGVRTTGVECLNVDNHNIDTRAGAEIVQLRQVLAVINEEPCLFAVVFHEVVFGDLEGLIDALADRYGRDYHDEFAPAVAFVQLENGFDVNIGLAGSGFHFHVEAACAEVAEQPLGLLDVVPALHVLDVQENLVAVQLQAGIFKTDGVVLRITEAKIAEVHIRKT